MQAEVLEGIQEQLKQIRVYGVEKVITYLSYRGERIPSSEVRIIFNVCATVNELLFTILRYRF